MAVLIGWTVDSETLKSLSPDFSEMKANTATCFILAGASLVLQQTGSKQYSHLAKALAVVVATVGLLTLFEYITGWSLGIDELLFDASAQATDPLPAGRMGANTAFNFVVAGLSLLLIDTRWRGIRPTQVGALLVGAVALSPCSATPTASRTSPPPSSPST